MRMHQRHAILLSALSCGIFVVVACGSDDKEGAGTTTDGGADTGLTSGFVPTDAAGSSNGSSSGTSSSGSTSSSGGIATCPPYETLCDGKCIPTANDWANCGGCGIKCTGTKACSVGTCSDTCEPGLDICANSCVDKQTDDGNCGTCGNICGTGKGCVAGKCVDAITVGTAPAKCVGGGPPISETAQNGGCLGDLAQKTFRWSLCSCTDVDFSAPVLVDGYDSTKGPYVPGVTGATGGGVGANDKESASSTLNVGGDLWSHGTTGISNSAKHEIGHDLRINGPLDPSAAMSVGNDAFVNGDVTTSNTITVGNTLTLPADKTLGTKGITAKTTVRAPVDFPLPCDCLPSQLVPVVAIVNAHTGTNNDNASIGLAATALENVATDTRLDLPCGQYFLTKIGGSHAVTIAAHGRTALYIQGDVTESADIAFAVDPTGELDLFVGGTISTSASMHIGSPNYPALSRTYLGTTNTMSLSANVRIAGELYVGTGAISWSAASDLYGAVFTNSWSSSAATNIHYDRAILRAGAACEGAGSPTDGGTGGTSTSSSSSSSSGGPSGCSSCRDCNNQACNAGKCGACTTSADCCSPLECVQGECIAAVQ
jgi:hypothetical protein